MKNVMNDSITSKKKILQLINTANIGGAEKSTLLLSKEFLKYGYEVYVAFPPGPYAPQFKKLADIGITVFELPIRTNFLRSIVLLNKIIKSNRIDIIHSHQIGADLCAAIAISFIKKKITFVTTVHCFLKDDVKNIVKRFFHYVSSYITFRMTDSVFTVSESVNKKIRDYYHLDLKRVVTVFNSIHFEGIVPDDENRFKITKQFGLKPGDELILCAGVLSDRKGQEPLIRSLDYLRARKNLRLLLLGDGPLRKKLESVTTELHLDSKVLFLGFRFDIFDWMSLAQVYVQPSVFDPMPRAMLEALYLGLPVIASNIDSMREVIRDRDTGLLTQLDPKSIAEKIIELLDNTVLRETIAANGRKFVLKQCSMNRMVEEIVRHINA